jgi:hypothetical protein
MPVPDFSPGEIWTAGAADSIGLWLVKTQTIGATAVPSVVVTSAFSASYDNYLVTINDCLSSAQGLLTLQLGSTTSGYRYQLNYASYTNTPLAFGTTTGANFSFLQGTNAAARFSAHLPIQSPHLTQPTRIGPSNFSNLTDAGICSGLLNDTNAYTSFTLGVTAGTLQHGTIRVYGYRN